MKWVRGVQEIGERSALGEQDAREEKSKPGTFPYFCSIHPKTTGNVIVQ